VDLSGRRFAIELPIRKGGAKGCVSLPFWRYQPDRAQLELMFFGAQRSGSFLKGYNGRVHPVLSDAGSFRTAPVRCVEVDRGAYHASNLFGATTTIFRQAQSVVEVAATRPLDASDETDFLMTSVKIEPADARQITQSLLLRYEGRLTTWSNGSSVACGIERLDPDMTTVDDTTVDTCIFRGVIEHVSVIDGRIRRVIAERTFENTDVAARWPQ
jgi:hypothetical protein